ncbi:MAG: 3'(2'),5'-bisphosphate nucleotidase CysQ [Acidiferrobacterales bacterium]
MNSSSDPCAYLDETKRIAGDAGRRILDVYERDFSVAHKQDGSPLTEADRAAHQHIVTQLRALTPEVPVLSEESAAVDYTERAHWQRFWLVDPLDGTKEFVKRNGEFTVNIALVEGHRPVLGVVLAPVTETLYSACVGLGGFKQVGHGEPTPICARRYDGGVATVVASRSHPGKKLAGFLSSVTRQEGQPRTRSMGSALKMCLVAEGVADVCPRFGPTSEWDTAAAHCVLEAAGGRLVDLGRHPLRYNKRELVNPWFLASGAGDYDWTVHVDGD